MYSNFITPPDYVQSVIIFDATEDEIKQVADAVKDLPQPYNLYFYNAEMNNLEWLIMVVNRVDVALARTTSSVPMIDFLLYGEDQDLKSPVDYFAK